jgi:serine protease
VMEINGPVSIAPTVEYFFLTGGSQGGVYILTQVDATLRGNIIEDNERLTFTGDGGGVNVHYYGGATLIGNVIRNNRAGRHGGGLAGSRDITLISNVIAGNTCALVDANGQGAGLWLGRGELVNNTLANNSGGDGSAVRVGVDVTLTNTILYGNAVGVNAYTGSVVDIAGTLWYANGQNTTGDGTIHLGPVNVYQDPLFVDASAGDFHLGAGSPAIDAGVAAPVAREDAEGNARPDCIAWDIGAYEAQSGGTSCMRVYLPAVLREAEP